MAEQEQELRSTDSVPRDTAEDGELVEAEDTEEHGGEAGEGVDAGGKKTKKPRKTKGRKKAREVKHLPEASMEAKYQILKREGFPSAITIKNPGLEQFTKRRREEDAKEAEAEHLAQAKRHAELGAQQRAAHEKWLNDRAADRAEASATRELQPMVAEAENELLFAIKMYKVMVGVDPDSEVTEEMIERATRLQGGPRQKLISADGHTARAAYRIDRLQCFKDARSGLTAVQTLAFMKRREAVLTAIQPLLDMIPQLQRDRENLDSKKLRRASVQICRSQGLLYSCLISRGSAAIFAKVSENEGSISSYSRQTRESNDRRPEYWEHFIIEATSRRLSRNPSLDVVYLSDAELASSLPIVVRADQEIRDAAVPQFANAPIRRVPFVVCRESSNVPDTPAQRAIRQQESEILAGRFVGQDPGYEQPITAERLDRQGSDAIPTNRGGEQGDTDMYNRLMGVRNQFPGDLIYMPMIWRGPDAFAAHHQCWTSWATHWEQLGFVFDVYVYQHQPQPEILQDPFFQHHMQWSDRMDGIFSIAPISSLDLHTPPQLIAMPATAGGRLMKMAWYLAFEKMQNLGRLAAQVVVWIVNIGRNSI